MSGTTALRSFNPREEHDIPAWPFPEPPPSGPERVYVLSMRTVDNRLEYYFSQRPDSPDPSADLPLTIRVPSDCVIVLRLNEAWDWQFREDAAVVLGPQQYSDRERYFNLQPTIIDGICKEVSFVAKYLPIQGVNNDPYAVYLNVGQRSGSNNTVSQLLVRIDPDVRNPGDHDPPPP